MMFGERIKQLRAQKGLTQSELGKLVRPGVSDTGSFQLVSRWERGKAVPPLEDVQRLGQVLGEDLLSLAQAALVSLWRSK